MRRWIIAAGVLALAGPAFAAQTAKANLVDAKGKSVGTATLEETPNGVLITAEFKGLPPGEHAFHVHDKGVCEAPFESAGGHYNPEGHVHGFKAEKGPHEGDLPNIVVPASGDLKVETLAEDLELDDALKGDGVALVVHQSADDYKTDPAGAAGPRIACGVVKAGAK